MFLLSNQKLRNKHNHSFIKIEKSYIRINLLVIDNVTNSFLIIFEYMYFLIEIDTCAYIIKRNYLHNSVCLVIFLINNRDNDDIDFSFILINIGSYDLKGNDISWINIIWEYKWFFTPPRNRGGVIFSLQFVCLCVCVCVCVCVRVCVSVCQSVNKIPAKRKHQFGRSFY